jgi:hypothetical protein
VDRKSYWSVESCRWEPCAERADLHWSVQRCRWEPLGPAADALATPWSMFVALQPASQVPQQRESAPGLVEA